MANDSLAALREIYPPPAARGGLRVLDRLDVHCRNVVALSAFYVMSSVRADGRTDATQRGDPPGALAHVLDHRILLLSGRPGKRQADTLMNLA